MRTSLHNSESLQIDRILADLHPLRTLQRPPTGWLRAIREASGISAGELGRILGVSRQLPLQFERAEADDSITLRSLRSVAAALGCDLVYALIPRSDLRQPAPENHRSPEDSSAALPQVGATQPHRLMPEITPTPHDLHFCD